MAKKQPDTISLFDLLLACRDARATKTAAQQLVLHSLALRCRAQGGLFCFPSYGILSRDTGLHTGTCKRVVSQLENELKLIRRKVRHNRSNIFYVDAAKLLAMAEINRTADKAEREARKAAALQLAEHDPFACAADALPDDAEDTGGDDYLDAEEEDAL